MLDLEKYLTDISQIQDPLEAIIYSSGEFTYLTDGCMSLRVPRQAGFEKQNPVIEHQMKEIMKMQYYNPQGKYRPIASHECLTTPITDKDGDLFYEIGLKKHVLIGAQLEKIKLLSNSRITLAPIGTDLCLTFLFDCGWGLVMLAER